MLDKVDQYLIQLDGLTLDAAFELEDAVTLRERYIADVMADRLPDLLTSEDFDNPQECRASFGIAALLEDGSVVRVVAN